LIVIKLLKYGDIFAGDWQHRHCRPLRGKVQRGFPVMLERGRSQRVLAAMATGEALAISDGWRAARLESLVESREFVRADQGTTMHGLGINIRR
jgi:hypothetical protein